MRLGSVFVPGVPAPQGSKTLGAHGSIYESSRAVGPWRERVALAVAVELNGASLERGPVSLRLLFMLARPRGQYGSGRNAGQVKPSSPSQPATRPDLDKLARAVLDALTGILYADDAQVVVLHAAKVYTERESGVAVAWEHLSGQPKGG